MAVYVFTYKVGVCVSPPEEHGEGEVELYADSVEEAHSRASDVLRLHGEPSGRKEPREVKTARAVLKMYP